MLILNWVSLAAWVIAIILIRNSNKRTKGVIKTYQESIESYQRTIEILRGTIGYQRATIESLKRQLEIKEERLNWSKFSIE